jgi:bleomycin hydrolase
MYSRSALSKLFCLALLALLPMAPARAQSVNDELREAVEKMPHPASAADFQPVPHLPCLNQGKTSVCWSFATCSFVESEMARLGLPSVRLSVMYPAYCRCLEKARRFVQTKGASRFNPGDLFTGVPEAGRQYGALPASVYDHTAEGKLPDHTQLYAELEDYMQGVKQHGNWNESRVLAEVRRILNRHLGEPPKSFSFNGKSYTPQSFLAEVVRLPWDDYLLVTSFESAPFNTFTALDVPDNWRHNTNFFNVRLPVFYDALKGALQAGFSVAVSVDTTEPSYKTTGRYCFIPAFDLPAGGFSQAARELRFLNGATTDDHAIHIIGYKNFGGEDWFLAKDSWKTAWRDGNQGALFLHSSYVKLKVLAFIVHREGVPQITSLLTARN